MPREKESKDTKKKRRPENDAGSSSTSKRKTGTNPPRTDQVSDVIQRVTDGKYSLFVIVDGAFAIRRNTRPVVSKTGFGWDAIASTIPEEIVDASSPCERKTVDITDLSAWMEVIPQDLIRQITSFIGDTLTWDTSKHDGVRQILLDPEAVTALASMMVSYFYNKDRRNEFKFTDDQYEVMAQTWKTFSKTNTPLAFSNLSKHTTITQLIAVSNQLEHFSGSSAERADAIACVKKLPAMRFTHIQSFVTFKENQTALQMKIMELARDKKTVQEIISEAKVSNPLQIITGTKYEVEYAKLLAETHELRVVQPTRSEKSQMIIPSKMLNAIQLRLLKKGNDDVEHQFGIVKDELTNEQYQERIEPVSKVMSAVYNMVLADICKTSSPSRVSDDAQLDAEFKKSTDKEFQEFLTDDMPIGLTLRTLYDKVFDDSMDALKTASLRYIRHECYVLSRDGSMQNTEVQPFHFYVETMTIACIGSDEDFISAIRELKNSPSYKAYPRKPEDILAYNTPITFHEWQDAESLVFEDAPDNITPQRVRTDLTKLFSRWKRILRHTWHHLPRYTHFVPLNACIGETTKQWWKPVLDALENKVVTAYPYMHQAKKDVASDMLYLLLRATQHSEVSSVQEFVDKTTHSTVYSVLVSDITAYEDETPIKPLPETGTASIEQCGEAGFDARDVIMCLDDDETTFQSALCLSPNEFRIMKRIPPPPADTSMVIDGEQPSDETTNQNDAWRKLGPQLQYTNLATECIAPFLKVLAVRMDETDQYTYDFLELQKVAHVVYTAVKSVNATTKFTKTNKDHLYYRNGICDMIINAKNDRNSVFNRIAIPDTLTKKSSCKTGQELKIIPNLVTQLHALFQTMQVQSIDSDAHAMCKTIFDGLSRIVPDITIKAGTGTLSGEDVDAAKTLSGMCQQTADDQSLDQDREEGEITENTHTTCSTPGTPKPNDGHGNIDDAART